MHKVWMYHKQYGAKLFDSDEKLSPEWVDSPAKLQDDEPFNPMPDIEQEIKRGRGRPKKEEAK